MEGLAPSLKCVVSLRLSLENGLSLRAALQHYFNVEKDSFTVELRQWHMIFEKGDTTNKEWERNLNIYRQSIIYLIKEGLNGHSIATKFKELEEEIIVASDHELESYLNQLPFKVLFPLLFCLFPSYLILLFGPLVMNLISGLR